MWILRIIGFVCLALGALGAVLPVLPTTVFWIAAALVFAHSDPAWRDWIYRRPGFGPQVQLFIERGAMTRSGKIAALGGMAFAGGLSAVFLGHRPWILGSTLALIGIGALVVLTRKAA